MTNEKFVDGWKVRVAIPGGGLLHFVSATEPEVLFDGEGEPYEVLWEPTEEGDLPAYIDWSAVAAITWRKGA